MSSSSRHADDVRALFNAKAAGWRSKYRGKAVLSWRVRDFADALRYRVDPPSRVLDFGCGTGDIAAALAEKGYRVTGCDVALAMLDEARRSFGGVEWVALDPAIESLPFHDGTFAAVLASSVLEYVADVDVTFREWHRVLQPGGTLIVTVPNVESRVRRVERTLAALTRGAIERWLARSRSRIGSYVRYLSVSKNRYARDEWVRVAERRGFTSVAPASDAREPLLMLTFERR